MDCSLPSIDRDLTRRFQTKAMTTANSRMATPARTTCVFIELGIAAEQSQSVKQARRPDQRRPVFSEPIVTVWK
jgi:hypothetical protein